MQPPQEPGEFTLLPVGALEPSRYQPRRCFGEASLEDLADSIRLHGILEPLLVRPAPTPGRYEVLAGERRLRAARMASLDSVPVVIRQADETEARIIAQTENLQREDLNAVDKAHALREVRDALHLSTDVLARHLGIGRRYFYLLSSIDDLPRAIKEGVQRAGLSAGHAAELRRLQPWPVLQSRILAEALSRRLPVRRLKHLVDEALARAREVPEGAVDCTWKPEPRGADLGREEDPTPGADPDLNPDPDRRARTIESKMRNEGAAFLSRLKTLERLGGHHRVLLVRTFLSP